MAERTDRRMKKMKLGALLMAAVLASGIMGFPAMASTQKITSISLNVEAEVVLGGKISEQQVEITAKSSKYYVGDYDILNSGFEWYEEDIPELEVRIHAEDGYAFQIASTNYITVKGATVAKASKEDSKTLLLKLTLPPLSEQTQTIDSADWSSLTTAAWSQSSGAGSYEVKLIRDGNTVGTTKTTTDLFYDFSAAMTKEGTYSYKVRPVNKTKPENKGQWKDGPSKYVDAAAAASVREGGSAGKWVQETSGWWYQNPDGSYTVNNWQQIDSKWYFFNEKGYMVTGWINWNGKEYYCDAASGEMLMGTTTPDGHIVGTDGVKVQ